MIPASTFVIAGGGAAPPSGLPVSVYALAGGTAVAVQHEVCVAGWTAATAWQPGQPVPAGIDVSGWGWAAVPAQLPAALWGVRGSEVQPPLDGPATVNGMTGLAGSGQATPNGEVTVQTATLLAEPLTAHGLPLGPDRSAALVPPRPVTPGRWWPPPSTTRR